MRRFVLDVPHVLQLDVDMQLSVLVPNLVLGAAKNLIGREGAFETRRRLILIGKFMLCCKVWKRLVDSTLEYNALRSAQHEYAMDPNVAIWACFPREHNLITQFQMNLMSFLQSRYITSNFLQRILTLDLGYLVLRSLTKLRDELEMSHCAVEL